MNNIRKIIEERLENARLDYRYWLSGIGFDGVIEPDFYKIQGQIEAYQDCLNLMQPKTEQDIINKFIELGWEYEKLKQNYCHLFYKGNKFIEIYGNDSVRIYEPYTNMYGHSCYEATWVGYEEMCLVYEFLDLEE